MNKNIIRKEIFRCRVGSHLYGLNTKDSDEDFLSVFLPLPDDILGLQKMEQINNSTKKSNEDRRNTKDDVDDCSYSLPKFLHLLLQNNPNIVEVLFVTPENIIVCEPEFQFLINSYKEIISQKVLHTFTGYAFSQKKKLMVKKERYESLCISVQFMKKYFKERVFQSKAKLTESEANILNTSLSYYKGSKNNCNSFHKGMPVMDIYNQLIRERDNYGWRVKTDSFEKLGYDVKFAYHLIRILSEGIDLLSIGKLSFPIEGKSREDILRIRKQEVEYKELLEMYEVYDRKCQEAAEKTILPKSPNFKRMDNWLVSTLLEYFKNF